MNFNKIKNYLFIIPIAMLLLAIGSLSVFGLQLGIDLKGGSLLQVKYPDGKPPLPEIQAKVDALEYGEVRIQAANEHEYILRQRDLSVEEKAALDETLASFGTVEQVQFNSVGPTIGDELMKKAWWAVGLVALTTILFIAFAFRGISKPVAAWKYGAVAIITLIHDVLIPAGLFAYLGHATGAEVGALFIVALLTILGISINDTIVIFDRIRENINLNMAKAKTQKNVAPEPYADVVWRSVRQTLSRSINTSLTVVVVLLALFFVGPDSTKDLALTLIVGMIAGSYSSIILAAPMLILIEKYQKKPVTVVEK